MEFRPATQPHFLAASAFCTDLHTRAPIITRVSVPRQGCASARQMKTNFPPRFSPIMLVPHLAVAEPLRLIHFSVCSSGCTITASREAIGGFCAKLHACTEVYMRMGTCMYRGMCARRDCAFWARKMGGHGRMTVGVTRVGVGRGCMDCGGEREGVTAAVIGYRMAEMFVGI